MPIKLIIRDPRVPIGANKVLKGGAFDSLPRYLPSSSYSFGTLGTMGEVDLLERHP